MNTTLFYTCMKRRKQCQNAKQMLTILDTVAFDWLPLKQDNIQKYTNITFLEVPVCFPMFSFTVMAQRCV